MKISRGFTITAGVGALLVLAAGEARAEFCGQDPIKLVETGSGCMLIGQFGTVSDPCCQYIAPSDEPANVFAVTRDTFDIWVVRQCPIFPSSCTPSLEQDGCTPAADNTCTPTGATETRTIYLMQVKDEDPDANGVEGLTKPYRGKIHTKMGEEVSVKFGNQGGRGGVISVGQDEAIMNALGMEGGFPVPE